MARTPLNESSKYSDVYAAHWGSAIVQSSPENKEIHQKVLISNIGREIVFIGTVSPVGYYRVGLRCQHCDMNGTYLEDLKRWLPSTFAFRRLVKSFDIF